MRDGEKLIVRCVDTPRGSWVSVYMRGMGGCGRTLSRTEYARYMADERYRELVHWHLWMCLLERAWGGHSFARLEVDKPRGAVD